jgi:hypothetical protein
MAGLPSNHSDVERDTAIKDIATSTQLLIDADVLRDGSVHEIPQVLRRIRCRTFLLHTVHCYGSEVHTRRLVDHPLGSAKAGGASYPQRNVRNGARDLGPPAYELLARSRSPRRCWAARRPQPLVTQSIRVGSNIGVGGETLHAGPVNYSDGSAGPSDVVPASESLQGNAHPRATDPEDGGKSSWVVRSACSPIRSSTISSQRASRFSTEQVACAKAVFPS